MLLFDAYLFREDELEPAQNEAVAHLSLGVGWVAERQFGQCHVLFTAKCTWDLA